MAGEGKEYVIGKGKIFFTKFAPGSKTGNGEMYFGNTPELSSSQDIETLDHYDADEGLNVKDESVTLENNLSLAFATDNISIENLTLWYGGERRTLVQAAGTGLTQVIGPIRKGLIYQLGMSVESPMGARNVTNVVVTMPAADPADPAEPVPDDNIDIDLERGRIYIESNAPDIENEEELMFTVTYDVEATSRDLIIGRGNEIRGAMRFESRNPVGPQTDYVWPYVKLTPNGDYALKGDEWQQMGFTVEVLKLDSATQRVYLERITG